MDAFLLALAKGRTIRKVMGGGEFSSSMIFFFFNISLEWIFYCQDVVHEYFFFRWSNTELKKMLNHSVVYLAQGII